jgi:hypothetical protein
MTKSFPSLSNFREARKYYGTIGAMYYLLSKAKVCDECAEHFIDAVTSDFGVRNLEKEKAKNIYDLVDGFYLAYSEHYEPVAS